MITTDADDRFIALAARLTARAEAIGSDRLKQRMLNHSSDPHRWRRPEYLWPRFARG